MNLEKEISISRSKNQINKIARSIGEDQKEFEVLLNLLLTNKYPISERAAWVAGFCLENHPWLIKAHLKKIIQLLQKPISETLKRNILRFIQFVDIPNSQQGTLVNLCFEFLRSNKEPVAIKVYSMSILRNLLKEIPELKNELKFIIEDQMPYASPAFISRGKKTLRHLNKKVLN